MLTQGAEQSQGVVEVNVRPGEPVQCKLIPPSPRRTLRDVWRAARSLRRRTGSRVSLSVTYVCDDGGAEYMLVACHGGPFSFEQCVTFEQAIAYFDSIQNPSPTPEETADNEPTLVDLIVPPEVNPMELIKRKVSARAVTGDCTSDAGGGSVTERIVTIELSHETLVVDVTLAPDREADFAWDGWDDTFTHKLRFAAREIRGEVEADRCLAVYEISAEVAS